MEIRKSQKWDMAGRILYVPDPKLLDVSENYLFRNFIRTSDKQGFKALT